MSRFSEPQDPAFQGLNTSLGFDRRLWPYDVAQSRAHATMLAAQGIIGEDDRDALLAALDAVEAELARGPFPFAEDDEDIHMAIERRVTELAGPVGGKLHTARSRNDQVATDVAMFVRDAAAHGRDRDRRASCARCSTPPSSTSTGRCPATRTSSAPSRSTSPTTCSPTSGCSCATARASAFAAGQTAALPLGAGALAGVNFDTDRAHGRRRARLRRGSAPNSIDAVSNRDFVLDYLLGRARPARRTSRGSAPSSCSGRARSSASSSCPTRGRAARRSCRRRRTPTRPSCCARRRRGSSRT